MTASSPVETEPGERRHEYWEGAICPLRAAAPARAEDFEFSTTCGASENFERAEYCKRELSSMIKLLRTTSGGPPMGRAEPDPKALEQQWLSLCRHIPRRALFSGTTRRRGERHDTDETRVRRTGDGRARERALAGGGKGAAAVSAVPAGAIDCHIHIVGPQSKYPMAANRAYTPPEASGRRR